MIHRLRIVVPGKLYRGSAPSTQEVSELKDKLGIKKIVSLDKSTGDKIDRACKLLGIQHIKLYIDFSRSSLIQALRHNLKDLFISGGPTYVHCLEGKDRTGLMIALFKCKYMGMDSQKALEEAKSLGFGLGLNQSSKSLFEKLIISCGKSDKDHNSADIVSNERTYIGDNRDGFLNEVSSGDFSAHTGQSLVDTSYPSLSDQSPTRQNYLNPSLFRHDPDRIVSIPDVGEYDNEAGIRGVGPTEPVGGFIYDLT